MGDIQSLSSLLGSRLRSLRKGAHLDQATVAMRVGLSRASVSNIENGRQPVTLNTLLLFARALNTPLRDLIPDDSEIQPPAKKHVTDAEKDYAEKVEGTHGHP